MSCRIGLGLGVQGLVRDGSDLAAVVDGLEGLGFDSLWVSDVLASPALDPMTALAFAAGRTTSLKLGTSVVVAPGRSPARLAKEAVTLDLLSGGRFLPVLGLGMAEDVDSGGLSVERSERGPIVDEMVPLLRRLWAEDEVDHAGPHFQLRGHRPGIHPRSRSLPVWLGGRSRGELQRAGRLADGWLASFATVDEIGASIPEVLRSARGAGRTIDADHFGVLLLYSLGPVADDVDRFIAWRRPDRPKRDLLPEGPAAIADLVRGFLAVGASKFILVPSSRPDDWADHLAILADVIADLEGAVIPSGS